MLDAPPGARLFPDGFDVPGAPLIPDDELPVLELPPISGVADEPVPVPIVPDEDPVPMPVVPAPVDDPAAPPVPPAAPPAPPPAPPAPTPPPPAAKAIEVLSASALASAIVAIVILCSLSVSFWLNHKQVPTFLRSPITTTSKDGLAVVCPGHAHSPDRNALVYGRCGDPDAAIRHATCRGPARPA